jgi:anaerobic selenocysteine-containing dehydrogenase
MDRRSFIKLTAITGTSATLASCGNPEHQLIRFVPDEELVPGVAEWRPSVCPLCRSGCGVTARIMEADVEVVRGGQPGVVRKGVAKKLEGNPAHPISQGALCARGQAAIQVTYHPDRIAHPLKRSGPRGEGRFEEITWDQAIAELVTHLDALQAAGNQKSLGFLTRPDASQRHALVEQFLARFGASAPFGFELFSDEVLRRANLLSFGREQLPTPDLARTRYVLSFGADFLGTWNSPVAQGVAYGRMRQGRAGIRGAFVQVEARMTQTGANADQWVPVAPGTEGVLALGLAHIILKEKLRPSAGAGRAGALIDGWAGGLADYAPDRVEKVTGVPARRLDRLAREFVEWHPSVAIIAGPPLAQTNALFSAVAVNALNALAGNVGEPGGIFFTPRLGRQPADAAARPSRASSPAVRSSGVAPSGVASSEVASGVASSGVASIDKLAAEILSAGQSPVQALLVDGANPVFTSPRAWKVREAFEKIPFIASFGSFIDETSVLADVILPDHSFLESWVDSAPESGSLVAVLNVAPPAMKPLHQTRAMPDVLLDVGRRLRRPLDLPWPSYDEMLQKAFAALPPGEGGADPWATVQKQGGWWGELPKSAGAAASQGGAAAPARNEDPARTFAFAEPQFDGDAQQYPFHFLPYPSAAFLDGSLAHLPWLQELPDPLTSAMWSSWVEINPKTAERLSIRQGDIVEVASRHGSVHAPAFVSPALAPDIVAMPVGQGHQTYTRFASGRGENPVGILAPVSEPETGALAWAATRVRIARAGDADGRLILFGAELREHPHVGEVR